MNAAQARKVVAYMRTSTDEQDNGIEAQREAILRAAEFYGWEVVQELEDKISGGTDLAKRPKGQIALAMVREGIADALVVAKLDRLSRSVPDFGRILEDARKEGWGVVVLDPNIDTTSANGELVLNVLISVAQWERRIIGERTKAALSVVRERVKAEGGNLGRPRAVPDDIVARILRESREGKSARAIARDLTADNVPTAQGASNWSHQTVQAILSREARALSA
ncbi:DNA-invertase hin [Microbacterium laevaniformans]|uniref:DNA-invertase hin n=1 Tax=Microbacterium laevaniformans TaxID=36807 RepID=A0A150HGV6_9MICO|nr:recombinase family protein [Microbacterium laevaniformans]KXZ61393.1 DNA-invertase hin [Microbacterium laevaniformans]